VGGGGQEGRVDIGGKPGRGPAPAGGGLSGVLPGGLLSAVVVAGALVSAALAAGGLIPTSAGARVILDKATGQRFGIVPAPSVSRPLEPALVGADPFRTPEKPTCSTAIDPSCGAPLTNPSRGPVQHSEQDYLFLWDPGLTLPSGYVAGIHRWLADLAAEDYRTGHAPGTATGNPVSVVQQYYDFSGPGGSKSFVPYDVQSSGTITDREPYPARRCTNSYWHWVSGQEVSYRLPRCLTVGQVQRELRRYTTVHHLPVGLDTEYFVITPPGVGDCTDGSSSVCADESYCGIHSTTGLGPHQIVYAVLPWLQNSTCDISEEGVSPLHSAAIDTILGVFSHELSESMTDPDLNAWRGPGGSGDEIGDKCAYQYAVGRPLFSFTGLPGIGGRHYNSTLRGHHYLLQMEYDNAAQGCTGWDTQVQPTARISTPHGARAGRLTALSLDQVSDPAGIAYVDWTLGDGQSARSLGARSIRHTYARPGRYAVTAVITDRGGNEVIETARLRILKPRR